MAFLGIKEHNRIWSDDTLNIGIAFITSFAFFWLTYYVSNIYMNTIGKDNKAYHDMKPGKKADYLSRVVANVHAVLSCIAAVISFYGQW